MDLRDVIIAIEKALKRCDDDDNFRALWDGMDSDTLSEHLVHSIVGSINGGIAQTKDEIDWSHLDSEFAWIARDADGAVYAYKNPPKCEDGEWCPSCDDISAATRIDGRFTSYKRGTVPWGESLVERPDETD